MVTIDTSTLREWKIQRVNASMEVNPQTNLSCSVSVSELCMNTLDHICLLQFFREMESPLDCKEIQPVHPKGNQPWIVIGRTDAEAEAPVLWPPDVKNWLIGKDPDAGKGGERGWDGWIASETQWTWVWANSRRWWRTRKPGVLQSMALQRVGHNWVTEHNNHPILHRLTNGKE